MNLITGEAYGTAYVAMNSKSIGADFVYAWPDAKVGMMDADLAVKIMYADASADELAEKAKEYDALQGSVMTAARRGYVDLIVDPADTGAARDEQEFKTVMSVQTDRSCF